MRRRLGYAMRIKGEHKGSPYMYEILPGEEFMTMYSIHPGALIWGKLEKTERISGSVWIELSWLSAEQILL